MRSDLTDTVLKRLEHLDLRFVPSLVDHTSIRAAPETRVTTLANGLRVATKSTLAFKDTATVIGVWIDARSRFETEGTNATAHFLEHMIFKGNASWREVIADMVGDINTFTPREQTACYARVFNEDVSKVLEILADILQNSTFDAERIEQARDVILCEIEEVEDRTEEVLDLLHCAAFGNTPLGRTIWGSAENIESITQEHLKNYMTTHYTAPRVVISAAGAVKHEEVVELVNKLFTKLPSDPTTSSQLVAKSPASFTGSEVRIIDGDIKMAHFAVAFEGPAATDPDSIALMVMLSLLDFGTKCEHSGSVLSFVLL
ncbi:putative mitochondrial-processing peptidase subunit beta [Carex littledalei]|uniref:Putative mitochondrial-processing peptidase subunit beta n=1 Tax=Carex littledalei TaxID=544730 RepID=A0A833QTB0_9POAL|nr:putative mitochondrial-processing peptidase subunit beta [Carex littledalei]